MTFWLGIDQGSKRIGVAAGSIPPGIATPLEVVPAEPHQAALDRIAQLAAAYHAGGVVVGLPLNMDDTQGPQAALARELAGQVAEATGLAVRMWDERLSSFAADKLLAGKLTRKKRQALQDALAAATMLQDFFDSKGPKQAQRWDRVSGDR